MSDATFLILFLAITAIMAIFPFLMKRFGIPAVISLLIVGMLIGPTGVGIDLIPYISKGLAFLIGADAPDTARTFTIFVDKLGSLGLMFLMALAGMEADFKLINSCRKPVAMLSLFTFFLPAAGGFLLYRHFFPEQTAGQLLYASLFASHSVGIVFPVMRDLQLTKTRFGASVLIATVVTDIASILLLAVSVQLFKQSGFAQGAQPETLSILERHADLLEPHFMIVFACVVVAYVIFTVLGVHRLGKILVKRLSPSEDILVTVILLVILVAALVGEFFGINFIVGSFISGLGLSRAVRQQDMLLFKRFESIGYGFLIPFLFVSIGMKTDFTVFTRPGSLTIVVSTILVLVGTKIASGFMALRLSGFRMRAGLAAGLMTVPQLSATLTAAAIGKGLGILDEQFFNAIIILSIVTTLPVPTLVRKVLFSRRKHIPVSYIDDFDVPDVVQDEDLL